MTLVAQYSYSASPALDALEHHLPPVTPQPSPLAPARMPLSRQRFQHQPSTASMVGSIVFALFLVFGTLQVGRAMLENITDLAKLSSEANYIEQAYTDSIAQRQQFLSKIDFYRSEEGTESLIRNYLNAVGPDEILVTLQ